MQNKINCIQSNCSFLLESMETAMEEIRIASARKVEEVMMHNAELESKIMNAEVPKEEEDKLIKMCENRLILRNTAEARVIIN